MAGVDTKHILELCLYESSLSIYEIPLSNSFFFKQKVLSRSELRRRNHANRVRLHRTIGQPNGNAGWIL
jgi:hypothetical protein